MSALPLPPGHPLGMPSLGRLDPRQAGRLQMAQALMRGGFDTSPVQHPIQGLARMGQALVGGYFANKVSEDAESRQKQSATTLAEALKAGQGAPAGLDPKTGITWDTARAPDPRAMAAVLAGNPDTAPFALQMQLSEIQNQAAMDKALKLEEAKRRGEPPKTREVKQGGNIVTQEYNPETRQWTNIATGPQFQPRLYSPEEVAQRKEIAAAGRPQNIGSIPPGHQLMTGPDGSMSMTPIPGSPAAAKADEAQMAKGLKTAAQQRTTDVVTQDIGRALKILKESPNLTAGVGGSLLSGLPGTGARDFRALVDTVKANIGFDKLQAMRDASPTGGALGQVSEFENRLLQATLANLEQSQSPEQLEDNLKRVNNTYLDIVHGPGKGPEREKLKFQQGPEGQNGLQPGVVEDGYRYKGGDPSRRENWEKVS